MYFFFAIYQIFPFQNTCSTSLWRKTWLGDANFPRNRAFCDETACVCLVLGVRLATLSGSSFSASHAIALLQWIVIQKVACFSHSIGLCPVTSCYVLTLVCGMSWFSWLVLDAEAKVCAWIRLVGQTTISFGRSLLQSYFQHFNWDLEESQKSHSK